MKPRNRTEVLALIVRVVLGFWFVYSGGEKVFGSGLDQFVRAIGYYQIKFIHAPWDAVAAYAVPWFEMVAGVCLMLGIFRRGAILTVAGLVVVFSFCIGWAWVHQLNIACGCHGSDAPIRYWSKAAEFAGYFLALSWLWWMESRVKVAPDEQKSQTMA
jgi:uncharacterized membrane protein YphA (DoxX/SURF4 family)